MYPLSTTKDGTTLTFTTLTKNTQTEAEIKGDVEFMLNEYAKGMRLHHESAGPRMHLHLRRPETVWSSLICPAFRREKLLLNRVDGRIAFKA
jgi:hypothetical protein